MDLALIAETAGGGGGFLACTGLGRWLYRRSRSRHQQRAIKANLETTDAYLELTGLVNSTRLEVDAFVNRLGPNDAQSFRAEADQTLKVADQAGTAYMDYANASDQNSPTAKVRRGKYMRMDSEYSEFGKKLRRHIELLGQLSTQIYHKSERIDAIAQWQETVATVIAEADASTTTQEAEGWAVGSIRELLESARANQSRGASSAEKLEYLSAIDSLDTAYEDALSADKRARGLLDLQRQYLKFATEASTRSAILGRQIGRARTALQVLQASYAEACSASLAAELDGAQMDQDGLARCIEELGALVQKDRDAWGSADDLANEIEDTLVSISEICAKISGAKDELDKEMARIRDGAGKLHNRILAVQNDARDRRGREQRQVIEALNKALDRLETFQNRLSESKPNPPNLKETLKALKQLVSRLDVWSESIDEDSDSGAARVAVIAVATVIGLDIFS